MNDAIILQQINDQSTYADIMPLVFARHLNYAKAHKFDYEFSYGDIVKGWEPEAGGWAKLALIMVALGRGYKHVIWVDADSIIADMSADLREGCPPEGIGAVMHRNPPHLNVGNLYLTNTPKVVAFMGEWAQWYPGPKVWHEQAVFNLFAKTNKDIVKIIDDKYNSCRVGGTRVEKPAVEGFHGEGTPENRYKLMKAYLKGLK